MTNNSITIPTFHIQGRKISLGSFNEKLPTSGPVMTKTAGLGDFFDVAGHRTVVIGMEGGDCEVWTYPFKAARLVQFSVIEDDDPIQLKSFIKRFDVRPEASKASYSLPGSHIEQTIFAPLGKPVAVWMFEVDTQNPLMLRAVVHTDLKMMWPADGIPQEVQFGTEDTNDCWVAKSVSTDDAAVFGWVGGRRGRIDSKGMAGLEHILEIPAGKTRCFFVIAGSVDGPEAAQDEFASAAISFPTLYSEAVDYYKNLLEKSTMLNSSDPALDEAYLWAILGTDKCYISTPGLGSGFVAGYDYSGDGGRPGFGWYFGRDSSWTGFAANAYGDPDKVRDNIRLLAKYQIPDGENRGKIYHELSAAHDRLPWDNYAFPAGDATPFFVVDIADYYRWTGDLDFVRQMWPNIISAMDWCGRMDIDGDNLIDNPPAGHQWYDYGEKNMIDLVAIWAMALKSAADLAQALGEPGSDKWRAKATLVINMLNSDFYNQSDGYLYDRKLPDGSMAALTTGNPPVPLLWGLIQPEKAAKAIERMSQPDLTVDWGLRTNSNLDDIYKPDGYHEGTVWPLTTGWASLAAFANGRPDLGWQYLKANADLTHDWCLGYITEVLDGDNRSPSGCPHQAWSEAMVVSPVVEGMFGIRANWPERKLTVGPSLPDTIEYANLTNLLIGDMRVDVSAKRRTNGVEINVATKRDGLTIIFAPCVPTGKTVFCVALDGQQLGREGYLVEPCGNAFRVIVTAPSKASLTLKVEWGNPEG